MKLGMFPEGSVAQTQRQALIEHLESEGSITAGEARLVYQIDSLSSRISELRQAGYEIESVENRDRRGKRYVRYYLI